MLYILQTALYDGTLKVSPTCQKTILMMQNYAWQKDKMPHTAYSHIYDALAYTVLNYKLANYTSNTNRIKIKNGSILNF